MGRIEEEKGQSEVNNTSDPATGEYRELIDRIFSVRLFWTGAGSSTNKHQIIKTKIMATGKVQLHRVMASTPEKIFKAFTNPDALASWLPPYGFVAKVHSLDAKVGGSYRMSFINFTTGNGHSFGGEYLEIKPNELIKYSDRFDDPNLPGEMITTVSLKGVSFVTEIFITQEGIPTAIPVEMCYLGWQESLEKLKKLVEPNIPDA
jgi:uncharacterized protein YndB with AHSA1/START domain